MSLFVGVEFGARMITIDGKQIKLQIWDTVIYMHIFMKTNRKVLYMVFHDRPQGGARGPLKKTAVDQERRQAPVSFHRPLKQPFLPAALPSSPGLSYYSCRIDQMVSIKSLQVSGVSVTLTSQWDHPAGHTCHMNKCVCLVLWRPDGGQTQPSLCLCLIYHLFANSITSCLTAPFMTDCS